VAKKIELVIDKKDESMLPIFEQDEEWKTFWKDMPEFIQGDAQPCKKLIVSFKEQADLEEFAELVGQKLTMKTKSMWFPKMLREPTHNLYYDDKE